MERLTARNETNGAWLYPYCFEKCNGEGASEKCENCGFEYRVCEKLAEYEQAEEQGLLIRLKLKVGDIVYDNKYGMPCGYKIIGYSFGIEEDHINKTRVENEIVYYFKNSNNCINGSFRSSQIGKVVFLTLEEAEQALAKMKGE